jgi:hypothetical protein
MLIDPESPPLRSMAEVRAAAAGPQPGPPARVLLLLERCFAEQREGLEEDEPLSAADRRAVAALAEAGRAVDGHVADLLRWATDARTERGGDANVWGGAWGQVGAFLVQLVERWTDDLEPAALPAPGAWARPPEAVAQVELGEAPRPSEAVGKAAWALWRAGASDAALATFAGEASRDRDHLPETLARWLTLTDHGDLDALRRLLFPPEPLAVELGLDRLTLPLLARRPLDRLGPVEALLRSGALHAIRIDGDAVPLLLRAALRQDPDVLLVDARAVAPGDVELLLHALYTGHGVVLFGDSEAADALVAAYASGPG